MNGRVWVELIVNKFLINFVSIFLFFFLVNVGVFFGFINIFWLLVIIVFVFFKIIIMLLFLVVFLVVNIWLFSWFIRWGNRCLNFFGWGVIIVGVWCWFIKELFVKFL